MTMETLSEIQDFLNENASKGCDCPACGQKVKLRERKFNSGQARFMIALFNLTVRKMKGKAPSRDEKGWQFFPLEEIRKEANLGSKGMDYALVRHWDLAVQGVNDNEKKRNSGTWKLTVQGYMFVTGHMPIASHLHIFNNKVEGFGPKKLSIMEALGKDFDYRELIAETDGDYTLFG